jgi:hypothetical protein
MALTIAELRQAAFEFGVTEEDFNAYLRDLFWKSYKAGYEAGIARWH